MWMPKLKDIRLVNRECVCWEGGRVLYSRFSLPLAQYLLNLPTISAQFT